jgi:post-segregation antitoxin (ccd killing protein)
MATTSRLTITLPSEQVEALKKITDNVSGYVAEAVARRLRQQLLQEELDHYEAEYGAFTEEELAQARAEILGEDTEVRHAA